MKYLIALVILALQVDLRAQEVLSYNVPLGPTGTSGLAQCDICEGPGVVPTSATVRYTLQVDARFLAQNNDTGEADIIFGVNPSIPQSFNCFAGVSMHFPDGVTLFNQRVEFRPVHALLQPLGTFDSGTIQFGWHNSIEIIDPAVLAEFSTAHPLNVQFTRFGASCVSGPGNMSSGMLSNAGLSAQFILSLP